MISRFSPHSIQVKVSLILTTAISLVILGAAGFTYWRSRQALYKQLHASLEETSKTAALLFPLADIIRAIPEPDTSQSYVLLRQRLQAIRGANPRLRYVYLAIQSIPIRYIVEPEAAVVEAGVESKDFGEKGSWVAASAPIYTHSGTLIAILGMNISARQVAHEEQVLLNLALFFLAVGVGVALFLSWFLAAGLTGPLEHLVLQTERIASGDYSGSIPVQRRDELGELAREFNRMMVQVKASQDEIKAFSRDLEKRVEEKTKANLKLQEQLAQTAKMAAIGQLSAGIAHELRNPLGVISSSAYFLKEHAQGLPQDVHKHLSIIERNIVRSESIIKGLLDFSKSPDSFSTKVNGNDLLKEGLSMLEEEIAARRVRLTRRFGELPEIYGSGEGLRQAFFNIMLNAVQAMPQGGRLMVKSLRTLNDQVAVEIRDTGHGIPDEHLESIFNPFFTTKEPGKGVGLGLSLAYAIIEQHSGRITVKSQVGKGTTFRVELPVDRRKVDREDP